MSQPTSASSIPSESITEDVSGRAFDVGKNIDEMFVRCKNDNMREGVCYVDSRMHVTMWNRAAETITGIRSNGMLDRKWCPSQIDLRDRFGTVITDQQCPVREAIETREQKLIAASVTGRGGRKIAIDLHAIPVMDHEGHVYGSVILLHDLSTQVDLEQQVLTLFAHATRDQLTGVANRTHFERTLDARVTEFNNLGTDCSLIVTDIDFFKTINDEFGHHVGDQALMSFAKLIQQNTRADDIVARYGGEEFVVLCPNCNLNEAANRAEEIRQVLEVSPLAMLNGKCLTASFGVSQIGPGDTATTVFVKADQALLKAKESGRNKVVKDSESQDLCPTDTETTTEIEDLTASIQWKTLKGTILHSEELATSSPLDLVVEKIKGFVIDFEGVVASCEQDHLQIRIDKLPGEKVRRFGDRPAQLLVDVELRHSKNKMSEDATIIRVTIRLGRMRDRRRKDLNERVTTVMNQLSGFLMVSRNQPLPKAVKPSNGNGRY